MEEAGDAACFTGDITDRVGSGVAHHMDLGKQRFSLAIFSFSQFSLPLPSLRVVIGEEIKEA
ncbi:hypothetical protein L195_g030354 [Trifolium pratense]|uniref:Uncharacterized protein n=1 Tax=Trifolium pratense TaxID=57577 RepID=A0A2K3L7C0_TRIPR|nr:hypothetical protein L195_g030354 [Trifolium pratense]